MTYLREEALFAADTTTAKFEVSKSMVKKKQK